MKTSLPAICADLRNVPPIPAIAAKLLALLSDENVDTRAVAELLGSDTALTVRLLHEANSARYGRPGSRREVRGSIDLVGLDRTRQLVVLHATAGYAGRAPSSLELHGCWRHSLATAVLADRVAEAWGSFTKIAFTAGILHDIGRLGLMIAFPGHYMEAVRGASGRDLDLLDFERAEFGMDHAAAGRYLAETWNLPVEFRVVAEHHHDAAAGAELDLLRIVHCACQLADLLGFGVVPPPAESDVRQVLDGLPAGIGEKIADTAEELRADVEERMSAVL